MPYRGHFGSGLRLASAVLLGELLVGCAYGEMRQVLRAEVASEANCPEMQVSPVPAYAKGYADNQYKVQGCGIARVYTCNDSGGLVEYGHADCKYVAVKPPSLPAPAGSQPNGDGAGGETGDIDDNADDSTPDPAEDDNG